jgi:hypothetical protein
MADTFTPILSNQKSPLLDILPGEIRNQIIELCIFEARTWPALMKSKPANSKSKSKSSGLTVSVLPKWNGPGCLRVEGFCCLPLLFVNKQLHQEVLSYVDSMVDEVSIGGYILQFPNEDPRTRWRLVYAMLEKRPGLRQFAQNVKVFLPREGNDLCKRHWALMGLAPKMTGKRNCWMVLPELEESLARFSAIEKLVVVITVEKSEPPNFGELLSLYALFQDRITFEIVAPAFSGDRPVSMIPWVEKWRNAWEVCKVGG